MTARAKRSADLVDLAEAARERASVLRLDRLDRRLARFKRLEWYTLVCLDGRHLSLGARQLGWWIQEHFNDRAGAAWPGHERLGLLLNVSRRMVMRYVDELEARGWIVVKRRRGAANRGNKYLLALPAGELMRDGPAAVAAFIETAGRGDKSVTSHVTSMSPREVTPVSHEPSYLNHSNEPRRGEAVDNPAEAQAAGDRNAGRGKAVKQEAIQEGAQVQPSEAGEAETGVQIVGLDIEPVK
jgi:hypothetical protein